MAVMIIVVNSSGGLRFGSWRSSVSTHAGLVMITIRRPSDRDVDQFLAVQRSLPFSYQYAGCSRGQRGLPTGYAVGHYRVCLGGGRNCFVAAQQAMRRWRMFPDGVTPHPAQPDIHDGTCVAVRMRAPGCWVLAACRVVYVVDERVEGAHGTVSRFGFAYGTLPGHVARGEERFLVEWCEADEGVWFDLLAISEPQPFVLWLGLPLMRFYQRRFVVNSCRAMCAATANAAHLAADERSVRP